MAESFLTLMAEYCEEDQRRISVWYDAVQAAGFTGTQTAGLRHHVSLATFPLDGEAEAVRLLETAAARLSPCRADLRHVGVMPGGRVLFAAPDLSSGLQLLHDACCTGCIDRFPWLPHTTMLIDEPQVIAAALPALMAAFTPLSARIDRLRLCAFWPVREIASAPLSGLPAD